MYSQATEVSKIQLVGYESESDLCLTEAERYEFPPRVMNKPPALGPQPEESDDEESDIDIPDEDSADEDSADGEESAGEESADEDVPDEDVPDEDVPDEDGAQLDPFWAVIRRLSDRHGQPLSRRVIMQIIDGLDDRDKFVNEYKRVHNDTKRFCGHVIRDHAAPDDVVGTMILGGYDQYKTLLIDDELLHYAIEYGEIHNMRALLPEDML